MIKAELQARMRRLLEGRAKPEDLDRLFLDQRETAHGMESFRELGDFLAHRDERTKGPVTRRVRDVFTSFRVWSLGLRGLKPSLDDLKAAGMANLSLLNDEELMAGCGMRRDAVKTKFEKAFRKLAAARSLSASDMQMLQFLTNRFIWRPAFTDDDLLKDFLEVSIRNQVLSPEQQAKLITARSSLMLYAITRLHGAVIKVADGHVATLYAGFANDDRRLEVKVDLGFDGWEKPVHAPVCMFWTSLTAAEHCDKSLLDQTETPQWNSWKQPIELDEEGKLRPLV
ncbi:hypothetical protein [Hydrogenophaga borbori]|uniref:hypothetical protein n=1 Tax=Hydrogenophaga borbori TaxID=2294117 RepID=UPI0011C0D17C|nr:hypothetical protein [Hydrogenophaga borbori]